MFVIVPFSYPYHGDPIDTMYRPSPSELSDLFIGARLLDGTILGMGESYRDVVRDRPRLLLHHLWRFPVPFLSHHRRALGSGCLAGGEPVGVIDEESAI